MITESTGNPSASSTSQSSTAAIRIVAIMGSYRDDGVVNHLTEAVVGAARAAGAQAQIIHLKDQQIAFCTNCRQCMQLPGQERGQCIHHDDMEAILQQVDSADALVLAAPVNMWNINALTRRFMERCAGYGYWPWGEHAPKIRREPHKKAVLISSSGAPAFAAQWFCGALSALKMLARIMGAKPIGVLWQGKVNRQTIVLDDKILDRAKRLGHELAAR